MRRKIFMLLLLVVAAPLLFGFGAFSARIRTARMGVNPKNPTERIHIPEVRVPKFKAGKTLKDSLKVK